MQIEVGGLQITAAHVAGLPLSQVIGANQGVYALGVGPTLSHRPEKRPQCRIVAWIERGGAPLVGHFLQVGFMTGFSGLDWLTLVGSVSSSLGGLGSAYLGNLNYGPVIIMQVGSVAAGDVVRWRVTYEKIEGSGRDLPMGLVKGRVLIKALGTASAGAGATAVVLRPANTGQVWRLHLAQAWHDVGAGLVCNWRWDDVVTATQTMSPDVTLAQYATLDIAGWAGNTVSHRKGRLWVTYLSYPTFVFVATGAGQNGAVRSLVEEFNGCVEY